MTEQEIDTVLNDDRDEALSRGFTQHDTLTFDGKELRPMTAGTLDLLQKTGNRLLSGAEAPFSDAAGFALLHIKDEKEHKAIRAIVWKGREAWADYIFQFLNDTPNIEEKLQDAAPAFRQIIQDYSKGITRAVSTAEAKKNAGDQDGLHGSSLSLPTKRDGRSKR